MTPRGHIIALVQQLQEAKQEVTVAEVQLAEKQQIVSKIEALIDAAVNVSVSVSNSMQPSEPATAIAELPAPAADLSIPERVRALVASQPSRVFRLWDIVNAIMEQYPELTEKEQKTQREKSIRAAVARMAQTINSGITSPKRGHYQHVPADTVNFAKILYPSKFQKSE